MSNIPDRAIIQIAAVAVDGGLLVGLLKVCLAKFDCVTVNPDENDRFLQITCTNKEEKEDDNE